VRGKWNGMSGAPKVGGMGRLTLKVVKGKVEGMKLCSNSRGPSYSNSPRHASQKLRISGTKYVDHGLSRDFIGEDAEYTVMPKKRL